jgi:hypothetical protein
MFDGNFPDDKRQTVTPRCGTPERAWWRLNAGEPAGVFSNTGREITVANNGVAGSLEE